MSLAVIKL